MLMAQPTPAPMLASLRKRGQVKAAQLSVCRLPSELMAEHVGPSPLQHPQREALQQRACGGMPVILPRSLERLLYDGWDGRPDGGHVAALLQDVGEHLKQGDGCGQRGGVTHCTACLTIDPSKMINPPKGRQTNSNALWSIRPGGSFRHHQGKGSCKQCNSG